MGGGGSPFWLDCFISDQPFWLNCCILDLPLWLDCCISDLPLWLVFYILGTLLQLGYCLFVPLFCQLYPLLGPEYCIMDLLLRLDYCISDPLLRDWHAVSYGRAVTLWVSFNAWHWLHTTWSWSGRVIAMLVSALHQYMAFCGLFSPPRCVFFYLCPSIFFLSFFLLVISCAFILYVSNILCNCRSMFCFDCSFLVPSVF